MSCMGLGWMAISEISSFTRAYNRLRKETVWNLLFNNGIKCGIVNLLTIYRIIMAPVLLILLFKEIPSFKWILLSAFITDALDGFLARRWKVATKLGTRLDSLADDILFIVALVSVVYLHLKFFDEHSIMIWPLMCIFAFKMIILLLKHSKFISGLHTYLSKAAAFLQAVFFLHCIFLQPSNILFHVTVIVTMVAIFEEIIIIFAFRELKQNIKGLFFNRSQM